MAVSLNGIEEVLELLDVYDAIYPTNYEAEKKRFFDTVENGEAYNPQYEYTKPDLKQARDLIERIEATTETPLGERLVARLVGAKRMIEAIGSEEITAASKAVYGTPSEETVQKAKDMFHEPVEDGDEPDISAGTVKTAFDHLFDTLGMDYECRLIPEETNRNDPLKKEILIGEDITFSPLRAKRMLIHESTHAVRTYNGMKTGEPALIYGTDGYEVAEEGLPTFNESEVGVFEDTVPKITARVIAIAAADKSFSEMYELMRDYGLSERIAFIRTYRVKRGLADTARSGGFIKDHIYFEGYTRIEEHPYFADDLYVGKVSFEDMGDLELAYRPEVTRKQHVRAYRAAASKLDQHR